MVNAARFCLLAVPIKSKLCYRNDRYLLKSKTGHCVLSIFLCLVGGLAKLPKAHDEIINIRCIIEKLGLKIDNIFMCIVNTFQNMN